MPPAPKVSNHQPLTLSAGPIAIDRLARTVTVAGEPVHLAPTDYRLLEFLLLNRGRVVPIVEIALALGTAFTNQATNDHNFGTTRVAIHRLRKRLGPAAELVRTVPGDGFALFEEVPA